MTDVSKPDNYTSRAKESASSARQRIAEAFELGTYPASYGAVDMVVYLGDIHFSIPPRVLMATDLELLTMCSVYMIGDTKTTTRRMSDTPTSMRDRFKESDREAGEKGKSMLDSAQEIVAKALGGGSRGKLPLGMSQRYMRIDI